MKIKFHREFNYRGKTISPGIHEFDLEKEPKGFLDRWLKRGCTIVEDSKESKEEPKESKPKKKKKTKKKSE